MTPVAPAASPAQLLVPLLASNFKAALPLAQWMLSNRLFSPLEPVSWENLASNGATVYGSFREFLWALMSPDLAAPSTVDAAALDSLEALDPHWLGAVDGQGRPLALATLHKWLATGAYTRQNLLNAEGQPDGLTALWLRLPVSVRTHPDRTALWSAGAALNQESFCRAMASTDPDILSCRSKTGVLLLRRASGAWAWELLLASGHDPQTIGPTGKPDWQTFLPLGLLHGSLPSPVCVAAATWAQAQPSLPPEQAAALAAFEVDAFHSLWRSPNWPATSEATRLALLERLPSEWLALTDAGRPAWAVELCRKSNKQALYVEQLRTWLGSRPDLQAAAPGLAVALWSVQNGRAPVEGELPGAAWREVDSPAAQAGLAAVCQRWFKDDPAWLAQVEQTRLSVGLAPSPRQAAPRL